MKDVIVPSVAIVCLTIILCFAMRLGIDSLLLVIVVAAIAGMGGYEIKDLLPRIRNGLRRKRGAS